jgi:SanA protein
MKVKSFLKKFFYFILAAGFLISLAGLGIDLYIRKYCQDKILTLEEASTLPNVDCILVLGCGVYENGEPSPMLKDRLEQGILLYHSGASRKLLMSGDHGSPDYDEVGTMKQYALDAGVPSQDIFMDHAGFSTYESMYRALAVFDVKKVIIVTQKYNLYRAIYDANRLGIEAYGVSADLRPYAGQTYRDLREILARNKDFLYCLFKPAPSYLGDVIPISGNGDLTNDKEEL